MTRKQKHAAQRLKRHQRHGAGQQTAAPPQAMTINYGHTETHVAVIPTRPLKANEPILLTVQQARDMQGALEIVINKLVARQASNDVAAGQAAEAKSA